MTDAGTAAERLARTAAEFHEVGERDRLMLLLDYADELPDLPAEYVDHPDLMERVVECQAPVYLFVEVEDGRVRVFATAPPEAPTTRGFASILVQGLDGASVDEVLAVSPDYPQSLGIAKAISPLRLRGMGALLGRIQRQVREKA